MNQVEVKHQRCPPAIRLILYFGRIWRPRPGNLNGGSVYKLPGPGLPAERWSLTPSAATSTGTAPTATCGSTDAAATRLATATGPGETGAGPGGSTGSLEVLGPHLAPLPGGKVPVKLTGVGAGPGRGHRASPGSWPGGRRRARRSAGRLPLVPLALLIVSLVAPLIDVAIAVGQDVVLTSRRPDFGLGGPVCLSRPGFGFWPGCLSGLSRTSRGPFRPGAGTLARNLARRQGSRLPGAGGQQILVPGAIIEVRPVGRES
jgi:hypothetical protein